MRIEMNIAEVACHSDRNVVATRKPCLCRKCFVLSLRTSASGLRSREGARIFDICAAMRCFISEPYLYGLNSNLVQVFFIGSLKTRVYICIYLYIYLFIYRKREVLLFCYMLFIRNGGSLLFVIETTNSISCVP